MPEKAPSSSPLAVLLVLFMLLTAGASVAILMNLRKPAVPSPRPVSAPVTSPDERLSVFEAAQDDRALARELQKRAGGTGEAAPTSLILIPDPQAAPTAPATAAQAPAARPTPPPAAAPALPAGAKPLDPAEADLLARNFGGWDETRAQRTGSESSLLVKGLQRLLHYPRVIRAVLDNDLVVRGFMNGKAAKKFCGDSKALADHLSDTKNPVGVKLFMAGFRDAFSSPPALQAVLGSKLTQTVLSDCAAIEPMIRDQGLVTQIALNNPQALMMLGNPVLVQAMADNPAVLNVVSGFQTTASASPLPKPR